MGICVCAENTAMGRANCFSPNACTEHRASRELKKIGRLTAVGLLTARYVMPAAMCDVKHHGSRLIVTWLPFVL